MSEIEIGAIEEENQFFNEVYTKIFNRKSRREWCEEKVKQMAFVEVRFPQTEAIVITKSASFSFSGAMANIGKFDSWFCISDVFRDKCIQFSGGVMSLYMGISGLSIVEIVFWIYKASAIFAKISRRFPCKNKHKFDINLGRRQ